MFSFRNKVVWLTGASSGIGEALALELSKRGALCMLTARREDKLEALCSDIEQKGGKAYAYSGDVTDLARMNAIAEAIKSEHGVIDLLIPNAGNHLESKPEDFSTKDYLYLMDLNYGGILRCMEAVLPQMKERGKGYIAGMASLAGFRGLPRAAAYGASKAAAIHFLESARYHLENEGIFVSIINPGFVRTPLTDKNDFYMPFLTEPDVAANAICDQLEKQRKEISFPIPFNWMLKFMRVIPYCVYEKVVKLLWKLQERAKEKELQSLEQE